MNNKLGYKWLIKVFDCKIKKKAGWGRNWKLLIVNGHSSHINIRFLKPAALPIKNKKDLNIRGLYRQGAIRA